MENLEAIEVLENLCFWFTEKEREAIRMGIEALRMCENGCKIEISEDLMKTLVKRGIEDAIRDVHEMGITSHMRIASKILAGDGRRKRRKSKMDMTVYELIQLLARCENPNAKVYFRLDIDEDTIKEMAEDDARFHGDPLYFSEIEFDDDQLDINLYY